MAQTQKPQTSFIDEKVDITIWKEKKKKHKRMFQKEFEDQRNLTDQKFRELDKRLSEQIRIIQERTEDIEKKTLWRIGEIEAQIRSKINKIYVDDSCRVVEEKLRREIAKNNQDSAGNIQMYNELKIQFKYMEDSLNDKVKQQKRQINELEETLEKKYVAKISHDERSRFITEKFGEFSTRFKELEKKSELASTLEKQQNKIKTIEDKLVEFDNELSRKFADIMLHQQKEEYKKQQEESIHKICTLEGLVKNLQNDLNKTKQSKLDLDTDLVKRVESIENDLKNSPFGMQKKNLDGQLQRITVEDLATQKELSNNIDLLKIELDEKLQETIDKVYSDIRKMNSEERGSKVNANINEIFRRVDQIEQKATKFNKEMDTTSLFKQLRDKAENDQVKRDFMVQDTKISQINENINNIRKDLENMGKMYSKMLSSMRDGTLQTVEEQLVVMSKRLLPANCISCNVLPGKMNEKSRKQAVTLKTAQRNDGYVLGSDKKPYKIDINYLSQQQQQLTDQLNQQADSLKQVVGQNFMYQAQLSSIPSDQDILSLGVGQQGFVYLDKSQISNTMPILKKGTRPSTAKVLRSESKVKKLRPESAKET